MLKTRVKDRRTTLKERMAQEWTIPWHEGATVSGLALFTPPRPRSRALGERPLLRRERRPRHDPPLSSCRSRRSRITMANEHVVFFHYVQYLP
jgi:hypothetical protein